MEYFGEGLYLIFFTLAANFAYRVKGRNLSRLLEENGHVHHQIHNVMHAHPQGGTWTKYQQWMQETTT